MKDFEDLWQNKTKYVDVCDFMYAEENNLLKLIIWKNLKVVFILM